MEIIFKIQELDAEILNLKRSVLNSAEQKNLTQYSNMMKEGRSFINKTEQTAEQMLKEFNDINNDFKNFSARSEILEKQKVENATMENIGDLISKSNSLTSEFAGLEQEMRMLSDKISRLLSDYNNAMARLRFTKDKLNQAKEVVSKLEDRIAPQIKVLKDKIKQLEQGADKQLLAKYVQMRDDGIFPVFVHLQNNRCGRCNMELSLNFIEKLKQNQMLPCEECRCMILSK